MKESIILFGGGLTIAVILGAFAYFGYHAIRMLFQ